MYVYFFIGGLIDLTFIDEINPNSVLIGWQGGMVGGSGTVDVLTGIQSPSGKLSDTIAYDISDYPSTLFFGNEDFNCYCEDIYVGNRYFETFNKESVRFPFGFGLSYTSFEVYTTAIETDPLSLTVSMHIIVTNTGKYSGKEVVQVYASAPQGCLGKPHKELVCFEKTKTLAPNETQHLSLSFSLTNIASYDDSGATGHKSCLVLEAGTYNIYVGTDIRSCQMVSFYELPELKVIETLQEALAPVMPFKRFHANGTSDYNDTYSMENVPMATIDMDKRRLENLPQEIPFTGNKDITLKNVKEGSVSLESFVAQLSDDDLSCIIRGEGMGSSLVTPGTASAFGGVSTSLREYGIPAMCCDDGPSGMRLDCGTKAFSLPNGTMIGCTFNLALVEKLFTFTGLEMITNKVECLLGPGMNIHRHPLNGRNFEYFSEDPYLTGVMAIAELKGFHHSGVTGTIKHFCGNNQEKRRRFIDSVISERALREIYLKGFEMAVKSGYSDSIMTTYGAVNGLWTAGNYDLNTTILRKEWGFTGIVMTDWWADINLLGNAPTSTNFAAMTRAQNDLYMVCPDGSKNATGDNTLSSLEDGTLTRGELQRNAMNICAFAMNTQAMARQLGTQINVEIINRPNDEDDIDLSNVTFYETTDSLSVSLTDKDSKAKTNYILPLDAKKIGMYRITLTGSSTLDKLAQIPCTLFYSGIPVLTWTFNGTEGKDVSFVNEFPVTQRFNILRLYVARNGVSLKEIRFEYIGEIDPEILAQWN